MVNYDYFSEVEVKGKKVLIIGVIKLPFFIFSW